MKPSAEARTSIVEYLHRQLIGPVDGPDECLADDPKHRYLMGVLYPQETEVASVSEGEEDGELAGDEEGVDDSIAALVFQQAPATMGLSFFVDDSNSLEIQVWGAGYARVSDPKDPRCNWRRSPIATPSKPERIVSQNLRGRTETRHDVLDGKAEIRCIWRPLQSGFVVTATLINATKVSGGGKSDSADCLFQVGMRVAPLTGTFRDYPRFDRACFDDEEEELALIYRDRATWAVGHGCSATWDSLGGPPSSVEASFLPTFEVKGITPELPEDSGLVSSTLSLQALWKLADGDGNELARCLSSFLDVYSRWIADQEAVAVPANAIPVRTRLTERMQLALARMRAAVELLRADSNARRAFSLAQKAMLMQSIHGEKNFGGTERAKDSEPFVAPKYEDPAYSERGWRPFQLAFQLLVLPSLIDAESPDRDLVDLLWFPTGGGKTEAYLALAAFEMLHRRLVHGAKGGGTAVITRYTLRLVTTQQFQRAAILACALEQIRSEDSATLTDEPFSIGLWVGESNSPNELMKACEKFEELVQADSPENPFQLRQCPWCGTRLIPDTRISDLSHYGFRANQSSFEIYCPSTDCPFHSLLPVQVVDEALYRQPPSLLIGTIDKLARLTWDSSGKVFLGADGRGIVPPSLIIQDELHLISGPLGSIAGIYEAALETAIEANGPRPKVIAATATIRRAADQIQRLYARQAAVFPPSGLSADDSFFARLDLRSPGRLYVGVMGQGHTPITSAVLTSAAILQSVVDAPVALEAQDPYWTLVMYHNSKRELGKNLTLARDDIPNRVKIIALDESRMRKLENVQELSANVGAKTAEIIATMERELPDPSTIDVLCTTNMMSVGVDVGRLGLMLVHGQPKTTAEYIQATSRIGRKSDRPGLVVSLYSPSKPRDRSHYEGFMAYHQALYRAVEPTSVTPFAGPARDRALHAALVLLMRTAGGLCGDPEAGKLDRDDAMTQQLVSALAERMSRAEPEERAGIVADLYARLEEWALLVSAQAHGGKPLRFRRNEDKPQFAALLRTFESATEDKAWRTLNSMRFVAPEAPIRL